MDRDSLVYKAKLAEQAERFDEMVQDMYVFLLCSVSKTDIVDGCPDLRSKCNNTAPNRFLSGWCLVDYAKAVAI